MNDFDPNVELIRKSVLAMESLCAENEIEFCVAVFPDEVQVDAEVRNAFLRHYGLESTQFDWGRAQSILRCLCRERGIRFIDLYPAFLEAAQLGRQLYLPNNGHWNDAGNELAATVLTDELENLVASLLDL